MASKRKKELLQQEAGRWRKWRRARRREALDVLRLLHLRNQITASGPVVLENRESLEAL